MADTQFEADDSARPTPAETPDDNTQDFATADGEWMTHGGPLGCLLAIVFGCLLAAFIASPLIRGSALAAKQGLDLGFGLAALAIMVGGIIIFGIIGWWLGKRLFREYPAPTPRS